MHEPMISVVIPTYESADFIQDSLNAVIRQRYDNLEILVSDDGSTDNTREIVKGLFLNNRNIKSRLLENEHRGPSFARNQGILNSSGEWIAFLDSDDLWHNDKLSRVAAYIRMDPGVGLWCHSEIVKTKDSHEVTEHYRRFNGKIDPFISMYRDNSLSTSAVTAKKDALLAAGLFDESLLHAEDYDLWLRLCDTAKIGFIKEVLGVYVTREGSLTSDNRIRMECLRRIAEKHHKRLKKKTRFYFLEEARFRRRIYIDSGLALISRKQKIRGLFSLGRGFMHWPFCKFSIKNNFRKILK